MKFDFFKKVNNDKSINDKNDKLLTLAPRILNDNEINQIYLDKIDKIINHNDCKNIAITGAYGSGKSSVIKTYMKKHNEHSEHTLLITIGSYIVDEQDKFQSNNKSDISTNNVSTNNQLLVDRIEESILKQIVYREKFRKFPKSSLIRLNKESHTRIIIYSISIIYSIYFFCFYYLKYFKVKNLNFQKLFNYFNVYGVIMFIIIIAACIRLCWLIVNTIKIKKVTLKDYEIDISHNNNSIFSRYLSEIVYYFQVTKKKIIIFEDIDRFNNDVALKVIQELKELNTILNDAYQLHNIKFIYAVRDDLFEKMEEKNKFFDYNLAILPVSTSFNSEIILVGLLKEVSIYNQLSRNVIKIVSNNIHDMRTLINIINDYTMFLNLTHTQNNDRLFAMVAFKNMYFKDYIKLGTEEDIIEKIFNTAKMQREELIDNVNNEIEKIDEDIQTYERNIRINVNDLKYLLVAQNCDYKNNKIVTHYKISGQLYEIEKFLEESFDINLLRNNVFGLYRQYHDILEEDVFRLFDGKTKFLEKIDANIDNSILTNLKNEKDKLILKKEEINKLHINEIFEEHLNYEIEKEKNNQQPKDNYNEKNEDDISTDNYKLLYELIANNYICKDYLDYVTSHVTFGDGSNVESLTASDSRFLMNIRQEKCSYDIELTGYKTILDFIHNDLSSKYILNYHLINYLFKNEKKIILKKIFNQFLTLDDYKMKFLVNYMMVYDNQKDDVLKLLKKINVDILKKYFENKDELSIDDGIFIAQNIMISKDYIDCVEYTNLKIILDENIPTGDLSFNILMDKDNFKTNLLKIGYKLKDISNLNEENFSFIYDNNLYIFSDENIKRIVENDFNNASRLNRNINTKKIYNYIQSEKEAFCNEYYITHDVIFGNSKIAESLFSNLNISNDVKFLILSREKLKFKRIDNIDKMFYEYLINYDHITINWENIITLYNNVDNNILFEFTTKNIDALIKKNIKNIDKDIIKQFFENYISYIIKFDLNTTEKVLRIYKIKYSKINNFNYKGLNLLIDNDCIEFNKNNYYKICEFMNIKERQKFIKSYYIYVREHGEINSFINTVSIDDIILLLKSSFLNQNEIIEILYSIYKKEKRKDSELALENIEKRLTNVFGKNKKISVYYNSALYNGIIKLLNNKGMFRKFDAKKNKYIEFIIK